MILKKRCELHHDPQCLFGLYKSINWDDDRILYKCNGNIQIGTLFGFHDKKRKDYSLCPPKSNQLNLIVEFDDIKYCCTPIYLSFINCDPFH